MIVHLSDGQKNMEIKSPATPDEVNEMQKPNGELVGTADNVKVLVDFAPELWYCDGCKI